MELTDRFARPFQTTGSPYCIDHEAVLGGRDYVDSTIRVPPPLGKTPPGDKALDSEVQGSGCKP